MDRGGVRIRSKPREIREDPVEHQQLGRLDPFEAENHRIKDRPDELADAVAVIPLMDEEMSSNRILEAEAREKAMEQIDTTVVGHCRFAEVDSESARPPRHLSECYLKGSIRSSPEHSRLNKPDRPLLRVL